jgi:hypothetical protein
MKIFTGFDDAVLAQYEHRGSSAYFKIYCQEGGKCYPSKLWMDFGTVILGWWIVAVTKLAHGESPQELRFMDGPYCLTLELSKDGCALMCSNTKDSIYWEIDFLSFVSELKLAAHKVIRHLSNVGVDEKGRRSLQLGLESMGEAG